jgi:hypothetical protein
MRERGRLRYAGFFESNIDHHSAGVGWSGRKGRADAKLAIVPRQRSQKRNYCLCNDAMIYA